MRCLRPSIYLSDPKLYELRGEERRGDGDARKGKDRKEGRKQGRKEGRKEEKGKTFLCSLFLHAGWKEDQTDMPIQGGGSYFRIVKGREIDLLVPDEWMGSECMCAQ